MSTLKRAFTPDAMASLCIINICMDVKQHNEKQIEHIRKHQWYMGEKLNREVSFDEATLDWIKQTYALKYRKGEI
jgi:hypothetical protein